LLYYTAEPLRNWNLSNDFYKGHVGKWNFEFDINTKSYKKVESIERADKTYFIVMSPKRNTIADAAIEKL